MQALHMHNTKMLLNASLGRRPGRTTLFTGLTPDEELFYHQGGTLVPLHLNLVSTSRVTMTQEAAPCTVHYADSTLRER